jgi:hypothetical protein
MKVRRSVVTTSFAPLIESMYSEPPGPEVGCATADAAAEPEAAAEPAPAPGRPA